MPRALRLISEAFVDLWHWADAEPELRIDMKRVNVELRKADLLGLDEDLAYRDRVKQRIREGTRCTHPPLIDRKKVLRFAGPRVRLTKLENGDPGPRRQEG
jgi:hypothetical protein